MAKNEAVKIIGLDKFAQFTDSVIQKTGSGNCANLTGTLAEVMRERTIHKLQNEKIRGPKTSNFTLSLRRGKGGGKSLMDNGRLIASIDSDQNAVFSNLEYAAIHNTGGIITPKNSRFLAVPATKEAKKLSQIKGVRGAIDYLKKTGWSIWFKNKAILGKKGKQGRVKTLFFLKKQIKIPKQEYLYIDGEDEKILAEVIKSWLKS